VYPLNPMKVYALEGVYDDPRCVKRMERMLAALDRSVDDVVTIAEATLPSVVEELQALWPPKDVPDGCPSTYMRPIVFTMIDLTSRRADLEPILERCPPGTDSGLLRAILGHFTLAVDQHPHHLDHQNNCVCWPTMNLGTVHGCSHGCLYCGEGREGRLVSVGLNLEAYMDEVVGPVIEANPWNRVFRMILTGADLITLEPEYGLHELFARKLAEYDNRWGHIHTASSNVDWLSGIEHLDRLVGVWSTTCEAVARDIEGGTGRAVDRIDAAARCQAMGLPVRIKFKPVIPVRNWREEYADIIREVFERTQPESVGFGMYMWHTCEQMLKHLGADRLDAECVEAARRAADEMNGVRTGPFPHEVRKAIYQHLIREARRWDADVPLYICTETREMWDELKDELGQDPRRYICACSSVAAPGRRLVLSPGFRCSTYHPTPL
jgi:DNA repair photolyase